MSWRGQGGGKRAKGRRGDQDPELDNSAWLAELEREEAARAERDEDEDDWASTLRGRRSPGPASTPVPPSESSWASPPDAAPSPPPDDHLFGPEPGAAGADAWAADPTPQDRPPDPDPDWSWRPSAPEAFGEPGGTAPGAPAPEELGGPRHDVGHGADWGGQGSDTGDGSWDSAGMDAPTGAWSPGEPVGREPDYPALFGELYRRSAAQQDPIWEAPPAAEPLPEHGQPDPQQAAWPFEETTQSWEPSDRSFVWPADELPSTPTDWDQPTPRSWLDDPVPPRPTDPSAYTTPAPPRPDPVVPPEPDQTAAWPSPWASEPAAGNGVPPMAAPAGPPPADWAAAIPTDVPAARRAADPAAASRVWRPDEAEPGVPLGPGSRAPAGQGPASRAPGSRSGRTAPAPAGEPAEVRRKTASQGRRNRQPGERQAKAWPRIVAVISWIVLVMVVCWFYVFPWLERVLPESF